MVEIALGCYLKRGMHRQNGRTAVDDIHTEESQVHGNSSTAALINLAEFGVLKTGLHLSQKHL